MTQLDFPIVLSAYTAEPILQAYDQRTNYASVSTDLGLTKTKIQVKDKSVVFPNQMELNLSDLRSILAEPQSCFYLSNRGPKKIAVYSEYTNRYYSLFPTQSAPTMLLSGIPMHRIKDTNPHSDTLAKMKAAKPVGIILDTTMGLGYTAIEAIKTASKVITIELDPGVIELCKYNPWSRELFTNPRILKIVGDSYELIQTFPDTYFSRVIHDPPTFSLAGDLYSSIFYEQVFRVLKPNGRLFHYIGDPNSQSGRRITQGVKTRLNKAGFLRITPAFEAFGLTAQKR